MRRLVPSIAILWVVGFGLSACAPHPRLADAEPVRSTAWTAPPPDSAEPGSMRRGLGSAELAALIANAGARNADLAMAAERIATARAALEVAGSALIPSGSASAGVTATRSDDSATSRFQYSDASTGFDASYELDLFGRLRAARGAARSRLRVSEQDRQALALTIEAEVARTYVALAALRERVTLLDEGLQLARQRQRMMDVRVREGEDSAVQAGINATEVRRIEVERTRLVETEALTRNALAVLVGEEAPSFIVAVVPLRELAVPGSSPISPAEVAARRPDVLAAEAGIRAANGDVEAARAAFLPRLTFDGSALAQAATLSGPVGATLSAGAGLTAPLLGRARLHGEMDAAAARQREAVAAYRGIVLNALREVENALRSRAAASMRIATLEQAVSGAAETARLARIQYSEGTADFRTLLDAEQGLLDARSDYVRSRQELIAAGIDLFKAVGGDAPAATPLSSASANP